MNKYAFDVDGNLIACGYGDGPIYINGIEVQTIDAEPGLDMAAHQVINGAIVRKAHPLGGSNGSQTLAASAAVAGGSSDPANRVARVVMGVPVSPGKGNGVV
jgi:hypothetical protein